MVPPPLPLSRINHITLVVKNVETSIDFYERVLGFIQIKRPHTLEESGLDGAWLWREGMAIHLIQGEPLKRSSSINVCADHLSFQPNGTVAEIEACLRSHNVPYKMQIVQEDGVAVPQFFFHDPDDHMLEICPCDCIPVTPLSCQGGVSVDSGASTISSIWKHK